MSVRIDVHGLPTDRMVFTPSPLVELGQALHVLAEPGHHPGMHGWSTTTTAALDCGLADRLAEASFMWGPTFSDVFCAFAAAPDSEGRPGSTLTEELDLLDRMDDERFVSAALEFNCSAAQSRGGPSPLSDPAERERTLELAAARGARQLDFTQGLLKDPTALRVWFRRLLEECEEAFFGPLWERLRIELAADARHKTELLQRKGTASALAEVSPALSLSEDGRTLTADKLADGSTTALDAQVGHGVTFVPTSMGWPHLLVLHARGWRPVVVYPAGSGPRPAVPVRRIEERMEALAHPARTQLVRFLARSPRTTGELADGTGMSAPEVSRHLAQLRAAGLVSTIRRGRYSEHRLELAPVARIGSDYLESILR